MGPAPATRPRRSLISPSHIYPIFPTTARTLTLSQPSAPSRSLPPLPPSTHHHPRTPFPYPIPPCAHHSRCHSATQPSPVVVQLPLSKTGSLSAPLGDLSARQGTVLRNANASAGSGGRERARDACRVKHAQTHDRTHSSGSETGWSCR